MKDAIRTTALLVMLAVFLGLFAWHGQAALAQPAPKNVSEENSNATKETPKQSTGTQLATSELVRIEQEVQQLNLRLSQLTRDADSWARLESLRPQLPPLVLQARGICASPDDEARNRFYNLLNTLIVQIGEVVGDSRPGPWNAMPSLEDFCTPPEFPLQILQEAGAQISGMSTAAANRADVERQLSDLNERREQVLREMTDAAGTSVADQIPILMLIIFGVGAVTLAGVKIFSDEVQRELVASGQIVQFVTILILLGVILALGIAGKLAAETLGTLLGGLAGYVLSQGVGRQALNEIKSATGTGPSPPPPPPVEQPAAPPAT